VTLTGGPFLIWVTIALLYYFIAELETDARQANHGLEGDHGHR
jgi:hypothetical protein